MVATDDVLAVFLETRDYQETANRTGLNYDAVRKRVKRNLPAGSSTLVSGNGPIKLQWLRTPKEAPTAEEISEQIANAIKGFRPPAALKTVLKGDRDLLGIWPLADLHMGMRAWGAETQGPDWDIGIATKAYQEGLSEVTEMTPKVKLGVVLVAGDLSHADNYHQTTTNPNTHHIVDVDGRYPKMLESSFDIVLYAVHRAKERAENVLVVLIPGNHDAATIVGVRLALAVYFRNDKTVTVDKSPSPHWWYEWGKCMFACTHGDKLRMKRLPSYMSAVMSEMWGRTKHRYAFTGHLHRKEVESHPGVRVEILPTPVAPDSFAASHGYNSPRMFETKVYHKERGLRHTPTVIL